MPPSATPRTSPPAAAPGLLCALFFLSGCAALLFETLWFRQAGLALGNSVWTSSIVLASFMAGLGAGNALAARHGARLRRPVRAYAALELLVGGTGLALVCGWPWLGRVSAPYLAELAGSALALDAARLTLAFVLMLAPAAAMGATLPLLVSALGAGGCFGVALGRLYGWNTLGAVAGALLGEAWLVEAVGVRGTGAVAAGLNLCAAAAAWALGGRLAAGPGSLPRTSPVPLRGRTVALLGAAALAGANLLALEVLWFRALVLNVDGTSPAFALMLAVVLAGIALGGLAGAALLRRWPGAPRSTPLLALLAGVALVAGYATLPRLLRLMGQRYLTDLHEIAVPALHLMLPTCLMSGVLFTFLGQALRADLAEDTRAAGLLTLANTLGALAGALLGGFVLLPALGVEAGLFALACSYGLLALAALRADPADGRRRARERVALLAGAAAFAVSVAGFPFGLMERSYLGPALDRWRGPGWEVVARREGVSETLAYLRLSLWGRSVEHRLFTNGYSMSSTGPESARYMRLFAYWASALHPRPRRALLISFGLGTTAESLTHDPRLETIDVVDVSPDILRLGRLVFSNRPYPLDDPRVRVHVEDGRFFLLSARSGFDIVTAEPPPPKNAGIVNLYSREHFELIRSRLAPGGLATYWLPVAQLTLRDARAVASAFCLAFEDCSLWTGFGPEWMLAGSRQAQPAGLSGFETLWGGPGSRAALESVGLSRPEQLGTTFLADGDQLRAWLGGALPVDDDHPQRLSPALVASLDPAYATFADPEAARARFESSAWVARVWPADLRAATLARFRGERGLQAVTWLYHAGARPSPAELPALLGDPATRAAALWALGSHAAVEAAALQAQQAGQRDARLDLALAASALASGRYGEAAERLERVQPLAADPEVIAMRRVVALALGGERERAAALVREGLERTRPEGLAGWRALASALALDGPANPTGAAGSR